MSDLTASDTAVPSIETANGSGLENAKNTVVNNASAAAKAVKNHPITQTVTNGPVAENIKDQHAKTTAEFSNLAASRTTPATPAATGQQLTHYHSFFSSLLSWNNPRASGIAYLSIVLFIFAARYLDILRYTMKLTWVTLAITVAAEATGKLLFSTGFTSQIRPKKYYTVSKATLDSFMVDLTELINFFVIESQRIIFAENVFASAAAFVAAFISYYLIKIVPIWGLCLLSTTVLFATPLIYKTNQELIDTHLKNASDVINQQTEQVKQLASHHAARATESTKQLAGGYAAKAQEMIGNRSRSVSPTITKAVPVTKESAPAYKSEDFPAAPKEEFKSVESKEPLIAS